MTTRKRNPNSNAGRKALPEGEVKAIQVAVRLSAEERKLIEDAAAKDGRTMSNYIRWAVLGVVRGEF